RIASPPAVVPAPRGEAFAHDVPDAVELAGMVVVRDDTGAERCCGERDTVRQQQRERHETREPGHGVRSYRRHCWPRGLLIYRNELLRVRRRVPHERSRRVPWRWWYAFRPRCAR